LVLEWEWEWEEGLGQDWDWGLKNMEFHPIEYS